MKEKIGNKFIKKTKIKSMKHGVKNKKSKPNIDQNFGKEKIDLEKINSDEFKINVNLTDLIKNRKSVRSYSDEKLSFKNLSFLLWSTQGVKKEVKNVTFRTVPSAGATHPFETFIAVNRVEGINPGLYHYLPKQNCIEKMKEGDKISKNLKKASFGQKMFTNSAVNFIWIAYPQKTTYKYGQRAYRYNFLDAGHICQNLYLSSEAVGAGVCAIGAYDDDKIKDILGLKNDDSFVAYMATVGIKNNK